MKSLRAADRRRRLSGLPLDRVLSGKWECKFSGRAKEGSEPLYVFRSLHRIRGFFADFTMDAHGFGTYIAPAVPRRERRIERKRRAAAQKSNDTPVESSAGVLACKFGLFLKYSGWIGWSFDRVNINKINNFVERHKTGFCRLTSGNVSCYLL